MFIIYMSMFETEDERRSFAAFYEKVNLKCLYVAIAVTKDKTLAEDAVHEAFIKFISKKDEFSLLPCNKQESLIIIITKNKAIDILRKERKPTMDITDEHGDEIIADDFNIEKDFETAESYKQLVALIKKLPEIYKDVFYMKYVQDLSNGEIAELLSITKDVVGVRLNRAKSKLKSLLKGDENYGY